eukprot:TRINITY_DN28803_c0_g1_i1.p1 TRINITY_DN28803_c0_g1~~TRINITY_DN28803_c0_g1_i1.p1  ORF type:complete len:773 (-),score=139.45 TRINITY_DN28803_c0_g1_i1:57-2339(-)
MACFCCSWSGTEGDDESVSNPGPEVRRRCTDLCCIPVLAVFVATPVLMLAYLWEYHSVYHIDHGRDHYQNFCGVGHMEEKRYVYFPDLQRDLAEDPTLSRRYGVCVESCPAQGSMVQDYPGDVGSFGMPERHPGQDWFVPLPSFGLAGRCIPYDPPWSFLEGAEFCASPSCIKTSKAPTSAQEICGLQSDGTSQYWLLSKADDALLDGWRREGIAEAVVQARKTLAATTTKETRKSCEVKVFRDTRLRMETANEQLLHKFVTKYTGKVFVWCSAVYDHQFAVLGLGIAGSLVASFFVTMLFSCCVRMVLCILVALLFTVLIAADYVLFFQAGMVTGRTGRLVIHTLQNTTHIDIPDNVEAFLTQAHAAEDGSAELYKYLGILLAVAIFLLACVACASRKNFNILVALMREAARTIREMPSLLVAPVVISTSMVLVCLVLLRAMLAVATVNPDDVQSVLEHWDAVVRPVLQQLGLQSDDSFSQIKNAVLGLLAFAFLWAYYFHVGLSITVVAMTVSHWYFYRHDPERNAGTGIYSGDWYFGRPILLALCRVLRYHLGSVAFGSCIVGIATALRLVTEYILQQTASGDNSVFRCVSCVTRCLVCCMEKCLKFITEYAYVYVAVTGKPFCPAAHRSFVFFAKYPVQTTLDKMASSALGALLCVTVPMGLVVVSFVLVPKSWGPCAVFIGALAYVITRLAAGVYDICLTTLFVCAMRDCENFGGAYMSKGLRSACGFAELYRDSATALRRRSENAGIELQESFS